MYNYNDIKEVHLEITQKCQAACPMCDRNENGGKDNRHITNAELSLADCKRIFEPEFIAQLRTMYMCGNLGDPIVAKDTLEVFKYFREHNPTMWLSMNTNAGAKNTEWWEELAGVINNKGAVIFSVDGLRDTNHLYRQNVVWDNVERNMKAFISAGGRARWDFLIFEHNEHQVDEARRLADEIGVERFVLDDGWFGSRRDDTKGLGDWVVSDEVWPEGLDPLVDVVKKHGMEFGLWFEGEMVNPDSDLYREHPDWILSAGGRVPPTGRGQLVLDLTNPDCYQHVLSHVDAVLSAYDISYIKWDHNRPLVEPGHGGQAAVHKQTEAIYRLFSQLKQNHPGLEIESCASGGGRIDLGMAQVVDRFWVSDCNDALERQQIQRYTQIAIPPEMLGSHIGPTESHTTGRVHNLGFRAITALFGHAGLEWDITQTRPEERELLTSWVSYYKAKRDLIHSGQMVRVETANDTSLVHGVVSQDGTAALFAYVTTAGQGPSRPNALRLEGLNPATSYRVKAVFPVGKPVFQERTSPAWLDGVTMTGTTLSQIGLRPPILFPENALLIEIEAL